ncbi:MAG: SET domain-containing protein-lysine N-methyltransferase [Solirubrobacterales bacterium]
MATDISPPSTIRIGDTPLGRGVIAAAEIASGETIEICPALAVNPGDATGLLLDYIVDPGDGSEGAVLLLGYGVLYNHSEHPNAEYVYLADDAYAFEALRDIATGEEITISYGEEWWETRELEPAQG